MKITQAKIEQLAKRAGLDLDDNAVLDIKNTCLIIYNRKYKKFTAVALGTKIKNPSYYNKPESAFWRKSQSAAEQLSEQIFKDRKESIRFKALVDTSKIKKGQGVIREVQFEAGRVLVYPEAVEARDLGIYSVNPIKKGIRPSAVLRSMAVLDRAHKTLEKAQKKLRAMLSGNIHVYHGAQHKETFERVVLGLSDDDPMPVRVVTPKPAPKKRPKPRTNITIKPAARRPKKAKKR